MMKKYYNLKRKIRKLAWFPILRLDNYYTERLKDGILDEEDRRRFYKLTGYNKTIALMFAGNDYFDKESQKLRQLIGKSNN